MRTFILLVTSLLAFLPVTFAQPATPFGMNFLSNLDYNQGVNDVWGYVDENGIEYALVGTTIGVSIVDVSDPLNPNEVQFVSGIGSGWRDMKTWDHYCYVSNESGNGLQIIDMSGLPGSIAFKDTIIQNTETIHNLWIDEAGYLYIVGANTFNGGMAMLDLNVDPWHPNLLGSYEPTYVHDVYVRNDTAYVAEMAEGELAIVDVRDRSNPVLLGEIGWEGGFTHNTWLNEVGNVCFTTDELGSAYVQAWDVSDPDNIEFRDRIRSSLSNGTAIPHNAHVKDDFLIISYYRDGVVVVDGSWPWALVEVGHFDTHPGGGSGFAGAWGAYPYLPSGNILVSDMQTGLYVIGPDYQRACFVTGNIVDSLSGTPVNFASVIMQNPADSLNTNQTGRYDFGVRDSGTYIINVSAPNYYPKTVSVTLDNGVVLSKDIELRPFPQFDMNIEVIDAESGDPLPEALVLVGGEGNFDPAIQFLTSISGTVTQPNTFVEDLEIIAGKWGYKTQVQTILPAEGSTDPIIFALERGYKDEFALDLGWTTAGTALRGHWERAMPQSDTVVGQILAPRADVIDDIGEQAYVTQNGPGNPLDLEVDSGYVELISPPIDLSGYNQPLITLRYWFLNVAWPSFLAGDDNLSVEIGADGSFLPVKFINTSVDTSWAQLDTIDVKLFLPNADSIQVKIKTTDFGMANIVEAGVDNFEMIDGMPSPPLSLEDDIRQRKMSIHANGSGYTLEVDLQGGFQPDDSWQVELYDLQGRLLEVVPIHADRTQMTQAFPYAHGLYLGRLRKNDQTLQTLKWVY